MPAKDIIEMKQKNPDMSGTEIADNLSVSKQYVSEVLRDNHLPTKRQLRFPVKRINYFTEEDDKDIKTAATDLGLSRSGFIRMLWRLWKEGILKQKTSQKRQNPIDKCDS